MPLLVGRAQVEKALLVDGSETSQVLSVKAGGIFLSVSRSRLAGASPWQQPLAGMGAAFDAIPQILQFFPCIAVLVQGVSLECWQGKGLLNSFPHPPPGQLPTENLLIGEGQVPLHLLSELQ